MTLKARFLALAWQLRVAVVVIFAEALATSVVAVFFVVALVTDAKLFGTLIALCVVIGGTAAFLFFVSRQLVYCKRTLSQTPGGSLFHIEEEEVGEGEEEDVEEAEGGWGGGGEGV